MSKLISFYLYFFFYYLFIFIDRLVLCLGNLKYELRIERWCYLALFLSITSHLLLFVSFITIYIYIVPLFLLCHLLDFRYISFINLFKKYMFFIVILFLIGLSSLLFIVNVLLLYSFLESYFNKKKLHEDEYRNYCLDERIYFFLDVLDKFISNLSNKYYNKLMFLFKKESSDSYVFSLLNNNNNSILIEKQDSFFSFFISICVVFLTFYFYYYNFYNLNALYFLNKCFFSLLVTFINKLIFPFIIKIIFFNKSIALILFFILLDIILFIFFFIINTYISSESLIIIIIIFFLYLRHFFF